MKRMLRLYVITDRSLSRGRTPLEVAERAIAGGATCIQLRDKEASTRELFAFARELRQLTREKGVAFIVNDRLDIALAVEAEGVHLGEDDLPLAEARRLMPPGMLLGASAGDVRQARLAESLGASYLGVGAVFATSTKADAGEPIGLQALAGICRSVRIPVVGIGGIDAGNARPVIEAGAAGVAVVSAVVAAADITAAASEIDATVKQALAERNPTS